MLGAGRSFLRGTRFTCRVLGAGRSFLRGTRFTYRALGAGRFLLCGTRLARRTLSANRRFRADALGRFKAFLRDGGDVLRRKLFGRERLFRKLRRGRGHALGGFGDIKQKLFLAHGGDALAAREAGVFFPDGAGYGFFMFSHG